MLSRSLMFVIPGTLMTVVSIVDLTRGVQRSKIMSTVGIAAVLLSIVLAVTVLNPTTWQERGGFSRENFEQIALINYAVGFTGWILFAVGYAVKVITQPRKDQPIMN